MEAEILPKVNCNLGITTVADWAQIGLWQMELGDGDQDWLQVQVIREHGPQTVWICETRAELQRR